MNVTWRYRPVEWTPDLETCFYESVCQQISGDDWDSTTEMDRDQLRGIWYHGYITRGASDGSY